MLMLQPWLWENMLADKVMLFGGNVVLCANSPNEIRKFLHFDYIGTPWNMLKGLGGEGDLSIRNRTKMLLVLKDTPQKEILRAGTDREDVLFVKGLRKLQKEEEKQKKTYQSSGTKNILSSNSSIVLATASVSSIILTMNFLFRDVA